MTNNLIRGLFASALWKYFSIFLGLGLIFKFTYVDSTDLLALHNSPFVILNSPDRQFLHGSIANILMGWLIRANTPQSIKIFYFGTLLLSLLAFFLLSKRAYEKKSTWHRFVFLIFCAPIFHVLIGWLGKADTFLFIGFLILFYGKLWPARVFGVATMLLAHREIGSVICVLYILAQPKLDRRSYRDIFVGFLLALVAHFAYKISLSGTPVSRMDFAVENGLGFAKSFFSKPGYKIYSIFIPFFPLAWYMGLKVNWRILLALIICLFTSLVTADFTRVFSLLSLPVIFVLSDQLARSEDTPPSFIMWLLPLFTVAGSSRDILKFMCSNGYEFNLICP